MMQRQDDAAMIDPHLAPRLAAAAVDALERHRPSEALPSLDRLCLLPGQAGLAAALRAEALLSLGRATEADDHADLALRERPADPSRLELRARAHAACGRRVEALDTAAAAVMAGPADQSALLVFGGLLLDERRFADAITVLRDASARWPDDPRLSLRLAIAFIKAGDAEAATATLDACAQRAPSLPGLAAARAQVALIRRDLEEAIRLARAGLDRGGPDATLYSILAHALEAAGRREEAWPAFRAAARLAPEDPYLAHLVAVADGAAPERATAGYVESVFDGYAANFETALIGLGYRVPGLFRRAVERLLADRSERSRLGSVLDLGCGTGLVGVALHDLVDGDLIGVDLSQRMLDAAATKRIYAELRRADLYDLLATETRTFDLITSADVFCYLGRLDRVLALAAARLAPEGWLLFSVERGLPGTGYRLHRQGRYTHAPDMLEADLAAAGLRILEMRQETLRMDFQAPVEGLVIAAAHAA